MASSTSKDTSSFEDSQVSSTILASEVSDFFTRFGIFYQEDSEIGNLVAASGSEALEPAGMRAFQSRLADPRIEKLLDAFDVRFSFTLGSDQGAFYAFTIDPNQDDRRLVYMWGPGTILEFSCGSHTILLKGVVASNGFTQIPYAYLARKAREDDLEDIKVKLERGGLMISHPRLAFQVEKGFAIGYGCQRSGLSPGAALS